MANLIITIVSIALVAVAALMAAWYGGEAFAKGQIKASAATLLTQAEQIIGALRTRYATAMGGLGSTNYGWGTLASAAPDYLSQIPTPPKAASAGAWSFGSTCIVPYQSPSCTTHHVSSRLLISLTLDGPSAFEVCDQLSRDTGRTGPIVRTATDYANYTNWYNAAVQHVCSCRFTDLDADGEYDVGSDSLSMHCFVT